MRSPLSPFFVGFNCRATAVFLPLPSSSFLFPSFFLFCSSLMTVLEKPFLREERRERRAPLEKEKLRKGSRCVSMCQRSRSRAGNKESRESREKGEGRKEKKVHKEQNM